MPRAYTSLLSTVRLALIVACDETWRLKPPLSRRTSRCQLCGTSGVAACGRWRSRWPSRVWWGCPCDAGDRTGVRDDSERSPGDCARRGTGRTSAPTGGRSTQHPDESARHQGRPGIAGRSPEGRRPDLAPAVDVQVSSETRQTNVPNRRDGLQVADGQHRAHVRHVPWRVVLRPAASLQRRERGAFRQYSNSLSERTSAVPGGMHRRPNAGALYETGRLSTV